ncbi:competence type IV pilus minor pilin ComGG [Streptococcus uberis]|uniref:competence type IV pilus minor pilin ComGG n=1 Tax=Streptococcus uberis TaxID=1349 RepID=UPI0012B61F4A|nr:competence type IV pilus minor pilin ComGG [Streptococcus uberis]MTB99535.1 hypothetical protein [Streptococcus uberis]
MILKKTVKGGILLYAILMTSIFLLLVQVYLKQMEAYKSEFRAQRLHAQAHMMAEWVHSYAEKDKDAIAFREGDAQYEKKDQMLEVIISLKDGQKYRFNYPLTDDKKAQERNDETKEKAS